MLRGALGSRYGISPLGRGVIRPAAGGWWLSGGIAAANCIAAYQPKGSASYAASKVNLANAGTYDAADGSAYPTWDATNGWKFLKTSSQYLDTGVIPLANQTWSAAIRFTDNSATYGYLFGSRFAGGGTIFGVQGINGAIGSSRLYNNGSYIGLVISGGLTAGVMGFAGGKAFLNAAAETGTIPAVYSATLKSIFIGANNNNGTAESFSTAYIQAAVFWSSVISDDQMIAVQTAMAAL